MKWIVIIALVAAGLWWAYNNTDFGQTLDNSVDTIKSKSMIESVQQTRQNRANAVEESLSR